MFDSVRTIAVYASDLERSKRFYVDLLGFEVRVQVAPDLCFLQSPGGGLHLYLEGGHDPSTISEKNCRLGFYLEASRPVPEVFDALQGAGAAVSPDAPEEVGDGVFTFRVEDPDGLLLDVTGSG